MDKLEPTNVVQTMINRDAANVSLPPAPSRQAAAARVTGPILVRGAWR